MIVNPTLPYGFVVFSDDVRFEVNGKTTVIGMYGHELIFHAGPPAALPQLMVSIWYRFSPKEVPKSIEIKVLFEGESGSETVMYTFSDDDVRSKVAPNVTRPPVSDPHAQSYLEMVHYARLPQPVFGEPGRLKVRAFSDGNEVRIGILTIEFRPNQADQQAT